MPNPTIFVITVCRNAVNLIEDTIKSVLSQTYPNVKYLIIDGASTDGTVDIIKRYEDKIAYWVSEPDKGIYDAMNKGLAKAREIAESEDCWVNFMNAGDSFADEDVLSKVFERLKEYDKAEKVRVIGGNTINYFADGHEEIHHAESAEILPYRLIFSHQASIAKLFPEWQFDVKYKLAADYNFFYQTYWKEGRDSILVLDEPIARYRQEDSASLVNADKAKKEYLSIQSAHRTWHWWKEYLKWRLL